ncbi:hypothetical protein BJV78DRAFT_1286286 [Lactifluus subvellereus]|nr:hypothetical protein BJV78DRAFT_1286286 [Lactifluus subvellereus]
MESVSTIEEIIQTVQRFRILSVGRSGVGKSSLINSVFRMNDARVSHFKPGEADIQQEFTSQDNPYFVLHDSKGFETGDLATFETVRQFIVGRSNEELELKEQLHALWLCTETPTAGGRVFEAGDEKLLQFLHGFRSQIPVVIVFTQYDKLVRTKEAELLEDDEGIDSAALKRKSEKEAGKAFEICVQSLQRTMDRLKIPMPYYVKVSVRPHYQEDVSALVEVTRSIVEERLNEEAWIMWAIAQRASLPVKINACVTKGMSYYSRLLAGSVPGIGQILLRACLAEVHKDIIRCWNFKSEVLNGEEFNQLMLHLVQDVQVTPNVSTSPTIDTISQFVTLVTAASAPIAPPVAILGLSYIFVQWLSTAILTNASEVQRLLLVYTVDLIGVMRELFYFMLQPNKPLATWTELQEAFEAYERSRSRQQIHNSISVQGERIMTADGISEQVHYLVMEYLENQMSM